jgi:hypothetical protein
MVLLFFCLPIVLWSCSRPAASSRPQPCDVSDADYKKDLDALYPIGDSQAAIEATRGKPKEQYLRAAVPAADGWINAAINYGAIKHGAKGASVSVYMGVSGTGGIASGGVYKDVLVFDLGGTLEWAYRFKLD